MSKVFKNGPSKICGRQPLKNLKYSRPYHFKLFKGCLQQILLGPFSNSLFHMYPGGKFLGNTRIKYQTIALWLVFWIPEKNQVTAYFYVSTFHHKAGECIRVLAPSNRTLRELQMFVLNEANTKNLSSLYC